MPAAANRRTTTMKPVEDWTPKKVKSFPFTALGKTWQVQPAHIEFLRALDGSEDIATIFKAVVAHVVKSQREEFIETLINTDGIDIENLMGLYVAIQEKAYQDIPTNPS